MFYLKGQSGRNVMEKLTTLHKRRLHWNLNMLALMVKGIKQNDQTLVGIAKESMVK